jgi:hypothetical protein
MFVLIGNKMLLRIILVFISSFILDIMWAIYIKKVSQDKPIGASLTTFVIYMLGGFVIINYTANHWLLLSSTLGACTGTYFATKYIK